MLSFIEESCLDKNEIIPLKRILFLHTVAQECFKDSLLGSEFFVSKKGYINLSFRFPHVKGIDIFSFLNQKTYQRRSF